MGRKNNKQTEKKKPCKESDRERKIEIEWENKQMQRK